VAPLKQGRRQDPVRHLDRSTIERLRVQASKIGQAIGSISETLVTKIMLGVFGCVPAFDRNFKQGFGVSTFGAKALNMVADFYEDHAELIDACRIPTVDFVTGEPTQRLYTRAKVIDLGSAANRGSGLHSGIYALLRSLRPGQNPGMS